MYEKVGRTIERFRLFHPRQTIVIGVSGGADSLCLLDCLVHLDYKVVVAHLDHRLRPESQLEARFVENICEGYRVPFTQSALEEGFLADKGGSLEEAARLARYKFLLEVAQAEGTQSLAVGHTADDQVETILMHFLRGSGPEGLQGMLPNSSLADWVGLDTDKEYTLGRPLIECTRAETEAHCQELGFTPIEDPSNTDLSHHRNRIRHELLPILETYNPGFRDVIQHLSAVMREQVDFNQNQIDRVWPQVIREMDMGAIVIRTQAFTELHPFLQLSLIRRAIEHLNPGLRDIGFEATYRAVTWMNESAGGGSLPGGLLLERFGPEALLRVPGVPVPGKNYPQLTGTGEGRLACPGELELAHGWRLSASREASKGSDLATRLSQAAVDRALFRWQGFPEQLHVRRRKPGDVISLPGVPGRTKISDLMINHKIPAQLRKNWPLVATDEAVLWVPGIQRSGELLLSDEDADFVVLALFRPDEVDDVEPPL